jgi:hypothetical protein
MKLIAEAGYGRVFRFTYPPYRVDRRPRVLVLGRWRHPRTRNVLVCGINLNYLSEEELVGLRKNLGAILSKRRLKDRYREGLALLPEVFSNAYRTYKQDEIVTVSRETLRKWPSEKAREEEERRRRWREMSPEQRAEAYRERARRAAATRAAKRLSSVQRRAEAEPEERYE